MCAYGKLVSFYLGLFFIFSFVIELYSGIVKGNYKEAGNLGVKDAEKYEESAVPVRPMVRHQSSLYLSSNRITWKNLNRDPCFSLFGHGRLDVQ